MTEAYIPAPEERLVAREGYFNYAVGVAMLNAPEADKWQAVHGREFEPENYESIIAHSEKLMIGGLKDVIRYANPPEIRGSIAKLENRFESALPHMSETVDTVYAHDRERIDEINPGLALLRPAPFLNRVVYRNICHGRRHLLSTEQLMAGFAPSSELETLVTGRTLET